MSDSTIVYNGKGDLIPGVIFCTTTGGNAATVTFTPFGDISKSGAGGGPTTWVETTPTPPAWIGGANYELTVSKVTTSPGPGQPGIPTVGQKLNIAQTWALSQMGGPTGRWIIDVTIRNIATGGTADYQINLQVG